MNSNKPKVMVLGATGELGGRIVSLTEKYLPNAEIFTGSRHPAEGKHTIVDIFNAKQTAEALRGIDLVINAVGPFDYDPRPLLEGCSANDAHYIDIAESPSFVESVQKFVADLSATEASPRFITGASTIPGIVEMIIQDTQSSDEISQVEVFLAMGSANPISLSFVNAILGPLGRDDGFGEPSFSRLQAHTYPDGDTRLHGNFPSSFPDGTLMIGSKGVPTHMWVGFDRKIWSRALGLGHRFIGRLSPETVANLAKWARPLFASARLFGTMKGKFSVELVDKSEGVIRADYISSDKDGLNIPALPSVLVARTLLGSPTKTSSPDTSLASVLSMQDLTESLVAEGFGYSRAG